MATFRSYWSGICGKGEIILVVRGPWPLGCIVPAFIIWEASAAEPTGAVAHPCAAYICRHTCTERPWYKSNILLGKASQPAISRFFVELPLPLILDAAVERCKCEIESEMQTFMIELIGDLIKALLLNWGLPFHSYLQTVNPIWLFLSWKNKMSFIGSKPLWTVSSK